jgi:hypothetical protein
MGGEEWKEGREEEEEKKKKRKKKKQTTNIRNEIRAVTLRPQNIKNDSV